MGFIETVIAGVIVVIAIRAIDTFWKIVRKPKDKPDDPRELPNREKLAKKWIVHYIASILVFVCLLLYLLIGNEMVSVLMLAIMICVLIIKDMIANDFYYTSEHLYNYISYRDTDRESK